MSTTASASIETQKGCVDLYWHHDGYPDSIVPELVNAINSTSGNYEKLLKWFRGDGLVDEYWESGEYHYDVDLIRGKFQINDSIKFPLAYILKPCEAIVWINTEEALDDFEDMGELVETLGKAEEVDRHTPENVIAVKVADSQKLFEHNYLFKYIVFAESQPEVDLETEDLKEQIRALNAALKARASLAEVYEELKETKSLVQKWEDDGLDNEIENLTRMKRGVKK